MIQKLERNQLAADIAAVDALLAQAPPGAVFSRRSLTSRRNALQAQIAALEAAPEKGASTALFFGGAPVLGSKGIDADFAGRALKNYETLVTQVWASQEHGSLRASGPVPKRDASRLHITNVLHGSFGFQLEELEAPRSPDVVPLKDAVSAATKAIVAAAESDDALADVMEDLDERVFGALKEFFELLKQRRASFRVVAGEVDRQFNQGDVERAAERTKASGIEEEDMRLEGELHGLLPDARTFEFRPTEGPVIRGRIAKDVAAATILEKFRPLVGDECVGHFHVVTLRRGGRAHSRHILRAVDELKPDSG